MLITRIVVNGSNCNVALYQNFITEHHLDLLLIDLQKINFIKEGQREIALFGAKPYIYGGRVHRPQHILMKSFALLARNIEEKFDKKFNSILVNYYKDGNSYIPPHSDDEFALGLLPTIVSVSVGATRQFQLIRKADRHVIKVQLGSGSLLVMSGETQIQWLHTLPPCDCKNERYNTFDFQILEINRLSRVILFCKS